MSDERRSWIRTVIMSVTIGFLSGVGLMAMTLNGDVREHGVLISRQATDFQNEQKRTDQRIFELGAMIKESNSLARSVVQHADKLVTTVEIQNRLILDQMRVIQDIKKP